MHLYSYTYTPEWSIPENAPAVEKCWDAIGRIAGCTLCEPQPIESLYNGAANLIVSLPQCYKLYDACAAMPRPRDHMFGPPESAMGGTGQADATAAAAPPFCDNLLEGLRAGVLRSSLRVWRDGDPAPITDFGDPEVSPTLCPDSKTPAVVMMEEWAARNSSGNYKPKKKKPTTAKVTMATRIAKLTHAHTHTLCHTAVPPPAAYHRPQRLYSRGGPPARVPRLLHGGSRG